MVPGLAESLGCGLGCHKRRTPVKQDEYPHLCAGNASSCAHLLAASPGLKGQNAGWGTLSACKTLRLFFSCDTRSTFPEFEFKNWIESHVLYSLKWQTEPVYRLCTALFNFLFPFQLVPIFTSLSATFTKGASPVMVARDNTFCFLKETICTSDGEVSQKKQFVPPMGRYDGKASGGLCDGKWCRFGGFWNCGNYIMCHGNGKAGTSHAAHLR